MYKQMLICCFIIMAMSTSTNAREISQEECKGEDLLQKCSMSMALPVLSSPEIPMSLSREDLNKSCVQLNAGINCIDDYTQKCMLTQGLRLFKKTYEGIKNVVNDLCMRGPFQDNYLKHADCVKTARPEYETCSNKYEGTLMNLNNGRKSDLYQTDQQDAPPTHEDFMKTVCCSFQLYLNCSERVVKRTCGEEASNFTKTFLERMSSNIINTFCLEYGKGCNNASHHQHPYLASIVLVAYFLLRLLPS